MNELNKKIVRECHLNTQLYLNDSKPLVLIKLIKIH